MWAFDSGAGFVSGELFEWKLMLGEQYQLRAEADSGATSQEQPWSVEVSVLRMAYSYPQVEG